MAFKRSSKVLSEVGMSSMTDLVFLLLIFFLITSTLINPNALKLLLPKSTGQISEKANVSLSIKDNNNNTYTYYINGNQESLPYSEVEPRLVELLKNQEDPTFSIYADETVPIKEIVGAMNIAKRNHYKVILATRPE